MLTLEQTATVTPERKLTIQVPANVKPGEHRVTIVIDLEPISPTTKLSLTPLRLTNSDSTYRREDIYGDNGR